MLFFENPSIHAHSTNIEKYSEFITISSNFEIVPLTISNYKKKRLWPSGYISGKTSVSLPPDSKICSSPTTDTSPPAISYNFQLLEHAGFSQKTKKRIEYLAYLKEGWLGNGGLSLDNLSLSNFLKLWLRIKAKATEPDLVLCPNGNIQAEWFKNSKRNLLIEFQREKAIYILNDGKSHIPAIDDFENLVILTNRPSQPFRWHSGD